MDFLNSLWAYIVLSAPYLLIGFFASGLVNEYFNMEWIKKNLGTHGVGSIIKASVFGVPLPLCSCAVIPAAVTLKKQGASNAATSSFLISTPESGVDSIAMTYGVMDLPMTIMRPIAAFITAFTAGLGQHFFNREQIKLEDEKVTPCCHKKHDEGEKTSQKQKTFQQRLAGIWRFSTVDLVDDLAGWLSIGLLLGAMINYAVPAELFETSNAWWGRLLILTVGIPFYICASASTPIAASMMLKGMSPGSALIFLLVGPATNMANLAVLQKYIGKKGIVINIVAIALVALFLSFVVDWLYAFNGWPFKFAIENLHQHATPWWHHALAIALVVLLALGVFREHVKPLFNKSEKHCH